MHEQSPRGKIFCFFDNYSTKSEHSMYKKTRCDIGKEQGGKKEHWVEDPCYGKIKEFIICYPFC